MATPRAYVPAAGRDFFLPLYDPLLSLLGGDAAREALLDQAALGGARKVLDVGCGTGTLAVLIKRRYPGVAVVGLDPDPRALARARRKAEQAGVSVQFDEGFSDELPYVTGSIDRVFSSFMLHHLPADQRERTLREVRRVLSAGGVLHLLDFGRGRAGSTDGAVSLLRATGFADAQIVAFRRLLFAPLTYYRASSRALPE